MARVLQQHHAKHGQYLKARKLITSTTFFLWSTTQSAASSTSTFRTGNNKTRNIETEYSNSAYMLRYLSFE
jgi:hypothetical protein